MSHKNKNSKAVSNVQTVQARPRKSVEVALVSLEGILNALIAMCDEAAKQARPIKPTKPTAPTKPAAEPHTASKNKKPAKKPAGKNTAKKQAEKPATADKAGKPGNAAGTDAAPAKQVKRTSESVRLTPHELTLNIGAQPVRELAEQDAKDLLNNPKVFWYRPIQFPDPKRYQVQPRIESARVVERKAAKFSRSPWTVNVTIAAIGDDKRCESWLTGVLAKNKGEQE